MLGGRYGLYGTPADWGPWIGGFGGAPDGGPPSPTAETSSLPGGGQYGLMPGGGEAVDMLFGRETRRGAGYGDAVCPGCFSDSCKAASSEPLPEPCRDSVFRSPCCCRTCGYTVALGASSPDAGP